MPLKNQVDPKWKHFGNWLRFDPTLMNIIETDNRRRSADCMLDLVTRWVREDDKTGDLPRTWETVVDAVKDSGAEHAQLARKLAKKYLEWPSHDSDWEHTNHIGYIFVLCHTIIVCLCFLSLANTVVYAHRWSRLHHIVYVYVAAFVEM